MFKDTDMINIYNDYDYNLYMPTANSMEGDYILKPKIDGEPYFIPVYWRDVVHVNRISKVFKNKNVRFDSEIEEEAYKQLRIDFSREKDVYSRQEIENMIVNPTDEVLEKIVAIRDLKTIETFLSQLVSLKNTNKYFIAEKVELYIRARKQELEEGIIHSELEVTPTEKIDLAVVEEDKEEITEKEQDKIVEEKATKTPVKKGKTPTK